MFTIYFLQSDRQTMLTLKYFSLFFAYLLVVIQGLDTERYRQEALAQHNTYRVQCKADPLQRNSTLDQIAQKWCEQLASTNQFSHSGAIDYGENSYKKTPFDFVNDNGL